MTGPTMRFVWAIALCAALSVVGMNTPAAAEDLAAGTVINAGNLDQMLGKTFEGKKIGDMIPDAVQGMIRNWSLAITLKASEEIPVDPRWVEATKQYASSVQFDPASGNVTGYQAGLAFPQIDKDDPNAGIKVMWNLYLHSGYPRPNYQFIPEFAYLMIDGNRGIERTMTWAFLKVWGAGWLDGDPVKSDSWYYKQILLAREPYDIRGVGTFRIRYNGGKKLDDGWAYVRTVRRTRRLSGGAWMDPIGGTDQLNDEISIYSPYPTWYPNYKLLGTKHILAITHSPMSWVPDAANPYPNTDLNTAPYWNPKNNWEPREVYVVEATLPEEHIYSRRVYYVDTKTWVPYIGECYDKRDELVKMLMNSNRPFKGNDAVNSWGLEETDGYSIDLKRKHATIFLQGPVSRRNPPNMGPDDVSLSVMEAIAQGTYQQPDFPKPDW